MATTPSPVIMQPSQPGILARIFGAIAPAGLQAYQNAQDQGKGKPASIGMGALGTLGQILQGFGQRNGR